MEYAQQGCTHNTDRCCPGYSNRHLYADSRCYRDVNANGSCSSDANGSCSSDANGCRNSDVRSCD